MNNVLNPEIRIDSHKSMSNSLISIIITGDCRDHTDCNPFTTLRDGSVVVSNFTMVCVQNPSVALGPCTGNPQGSVIGEKFTDNLGGNNRTAGTRTMG